MRITKYVHSCLLVETHERVVLFDPGMMSDKALDVAKIDRLDDIIITHIHGDHFSLPLVQRLLEKFPRLNITTTYEVVKVLAKEGITASATPPDGITLFNSPHEPVEPLASQPEEIGVHYLDTLSHPGDSHSFNETKAVLALPVTAPWGSMLNALNLAIKLKPEHVLPIHDWHWSDQARQQSYDKLEALLGDRGIIFHKLQTGLAIDIEL